MASEEDGRRIIARMDRIPTWSLPASFIAIVGIGYFFVFYDITDIGFAMPAIAKQFNLTGSESLFVALAVGLIGYIAGSYIIGTLADRYGRYRMILVALLVTAIGSFGDAAANGVLLLSVWRFATGMGVGADLNLVSTYISELAPPAIRGKISVRTFLIGIVGQAVTPFVALAIVPPFAFGWRLLFVIGGVVAFIAVMASSLLPESPRWLVLHGRYEEADKVVMRMERFAVAKGVTLPEPGEGEMSSQKGAFPTSYLFHQPYAKRLALLVTIWFLWYIGNYGFLGDAATLISNTGAGIANSIYFLAIGATGYPVGALIMIQTADRFERKRLMLAATMVWFLGMALVGTLASDSVIALGSFLGSLSLGMYLQVAYTFTAESYPTRARTSGFALSDGLGHVGGAVGALALPLLVSSFSFQAGFLAIGSTGLLAGLLAQLGPSVKGRTLESIST